MHLPLDPNKKEGMWEKLENSFFQEENCYIVSHGVFNSHAKSMLIDFEEAHNLIIKLKSSDYVRIGASRNSPIPPHFSAKFLSTTKAKIYEYISLANQPDGSVNFSKVIKDLLLIADTVFFDNPNLQEIEFPFELDLDPIDGYKLKKGKNFSILKRKNSH